MAKVKTAVQVYEQIEREAKENVVKDIRRIDKMEVGQVVRQGDIYIHCVWSDHSHGVLRKGVKARQLALGSTTGSRHVARPPARAYEGTTQPDWISETAFLGPCVDAPKRFTITHPEHADVELPAGRYQITHQMDARTLERVQD